MYNVKCDVAIIGGGPAGLAAAIAAKEEGAEKVLILERDNALGGILQQCIHDGFGLHRFGKRMSGNEYAQNFIDELETTDIEVLLDTMVLEVTQDKVIYACNNKDGMMEITAGAVILAMGCRERAKGALNIAGTRPAGIFTAGQAQSMINLKKMDIGDDVLILGSGDVGLIVARRLKILGKNVIAVFGEEEYYSNAGELKTRLYVAREFPVDQIGAQKVPKKKEAEKKGGDFKQGEAFMDVPKTDAGYVPFC